MSKRQEQAAQALPDAKARSLPSTSYVAPFEVERDVQHPWWTGDKTLPDDRMFEGATFTAYEHDDGTVSYSVGYECPFKTHTHCVHPGGEKEGS